MLIGSRATVILRSGVCCALSAMLASNVAWPQSPTSPQSGLPVALLGVPWPGIVQWPSLAVLADTIFVAGNVFSADSLPRRPAYIGRLRQNDAGDLIALPPLDLPSGDFQFAYPRIIAAGGRLHLVWAEFATRPRTPQVWPPVTLLAKSLWHATREHGVWSAPEKIATGYELGWSDQTGSVAVDASGTLHVTAWMGDSGSWPRANDLRLIGGRWDKASFQYTGLNASVAFASRGNTIVVGLVDERLDTARVIVLESTDQGNHWTNPRVVSWRPRREGMVSRLALGTTDEGFVLAIGEKAEESYFLDTIRVVRLEGSSVLSTTQFVPPPAVDQFVMTGTGCGSVVMLTRELSATPQIRQLTITKDSPSPASRLLLSKAGFSAFPGIIATSRSLVAVFGYNVEVGGAGRSAAMTLPGCSP